jgi:hypothetical protein
MKAYFDNSRTISPPHEMEEDCCSHCALRLIEEREAASAKGLQSLDLAFLEFLNLDKMLHQYILSKRGKGNDPWTEERVKKMKMNVLNDIINGKILIEDLVEPSTLKILE